MHCLNDSFHTQQTLAQTNAITSCNSSITRSFPDSVYSHLSSPLFCSVLASTRSHFHVTTSHTRSLRHARPPTDSAWPDAHVEAGSSNTAALGERQDQGRNVAEEQEPQECSGGLGLAAALHVVEAAGGDEIGFGVVLRCFC
jgi:hypothetical protein